MKRLIAYFFALCLPILLSSFYFDSLDTSTFDSSVFLGSKYEDTTVYETPQIPPKYVGGDEALSNFIKKTVRYPSASIMNGEQGKVYVQFIVEKDGSVSNIEIFKGVSSNLNEESMRVISLMPKWTPGMHQGEAVRTKVVVPVIFKLG